MINHRSRQVAVIIPYHNEGRLLLGAIASVNAQEFGGDVEIVVVDDASDLAPPIPTASRFPIRLVRSTECLYAGGARNLGVQQTQADFICFLDADDEYLPERIESHVDYLERHPEIEMVGSPYFVRRDTEFLQIPPVIEKFFSSLAAEECALPDDYRLRVCFEYPFHTGAMTVRRQAYNRCGGFDESFRWGEEIDLQVRLAQSAAVGYVPHPVMRYLCRAGSICSTENPLKHVSAAIMLGRWRKNVPGLSRDEARVLRKREHQARLLAAQVYLEHSEDPWMAWKNVLHACTCGTSIWALRSLIRTTLQLPFSAFPGRRHGRRSPDGVSVPVGKSLPSIDS